MICRVSVRLISWINAASVVDLPQPVGPLTRIKPCVCLINFFRSGCRFNFSTVAWKEVSSRIAMPVPRDVCRTLTRQRTPRIVFEKSKERRSKKNCHCSSPKSPRAISARTWAGMASPARRNVPRTRIAGDRPDSRCKSLAPLLAAWLINDSKSILADDSTIL